MMKKIMRFFRNETGATAVEYSILLSAIAAAIIATVYVFGGKVLGLFSNFNTTW
jgi:Flp pilus assembly pilin Flp